MRHARCFDLMPHAYYAVFLVNPAAEETQQPRCADVMRWDKNEEERQVFKTDMPMVFYSFDDDKSQIR